MATPRGSRKHILDWTGQEAFAAELLSLVQPVGASLRTDSIWMPQGYGRPEEARLGAASFPDPEQWRELRRWWLAGERGANTPNWDILLTCEIERQAGLVLVEAKANARELKTAGKVLGNNASAASVANHERIGRAIEEACAALDLIAPPVSIGLDSHYQLANRLAFGWKLTSLGIPTINVYLGFVGDSGIADVGEPFRDEAHWRRVFADYASPVAPNRLFERPINCGRASVWYLVRARSVMEPSLPGSTMKGRRRFNVEG